jgi:hypothetical protein
MGEHLKTLALMASVCWSTIVLGQVSIAEDNRGSIPHQPASVSAPAGPESKPGMRFVQVSRRDPRYFELSNGQPYIPIGFNLVSAPDPEDLERLVPTMAANRINYCRIWLDQDPWAIEHSRSGELDAAPARHLDRFLALCGEHGIRVKMCIESFRDIPQLKQLWSDKPLHHVANGGPFRSMDDFLNTDAGRQQFKRKLAWYQRRYGDEPTVFAWELWNEMNAVRGDWRPWTREMLPELHRLFPRNLVVQSLGSFDTDGVRPSYRELCLMPGNDVAQVHRYLDLGARIEVCHGPVDVLAADATRELLAFEPGKPVILTETGAVKPRHTGASELYEKDREGMLLHDMLFAPFFSGAAGSGHVWFWQQCIDQPDHWSHFARFARAIEGIDPAGQRFMPIQIPNTRLRIHALHGERALLAWCRDINNTWQAELVDGQKPELIHGLAIDLPQKVVTAKTARLRFYDPWTDRWADGQVVDRRITLPDFSRSLVVRLEGLSTPPPP